MIEISFAKKNRKSIQVEKGQELMDSLLNADIAVASSCHGDGICAKCRVIVTAGAENLTAANETEVFLKEKLRLASNQRISCQVHVLGPIEIDTTYW